MSDRKLFVYDHNRQHSKFKLHTNRQQDLVSQNELDDVAHKSLRQIAASKKATSERPLTKEEENKR